MKTLLKYGFLLAAACSLAAGPAAPPPAPTLTLGQMLQQRVDIATNKISSPGAAQNQHELSMKNAAAQQAVNVLQKPAKSDAEIATLMDNFLYGRLWDDERGGYNNQSTRQQLELELIRDPAARAAALKQAQADLQNSNKLLAQARKPAERTLNAVNGTAHATEAAFIQALTKYVRDQGTLKHEAIVVPGPSDQVLFVHINWSDPSGKSFGAEISFALVDAFDFAPSYGKIDNKYPMGGSLYPGADAVVIAHVGSFYIQAAGKDATRAQNITTLKALLDLDGLAAIKAEPY